jgi:hypothetical protein
MSKWEEEKGKRMQHLINKWIIQNKTVGEEFVAHCYSVVQIQCAELGDTMSQLLSKGQE